MTLKHIPRIIKILAAALSIILSIAVFFNNDITQLLANYWMPLQVGPGIAKIFASFTAVLLITVLAMLLLSFIFGRFYCSILCPLGILQDIINFVNPFKNSKIGNYAKIRYFTAIVIFASLIGGSAVLLAFVEPFSIFGRISSAIFNPLIIIINNTFFPERIMTQPITGIGHLIAGGIIPLLILAGMVLWKKRIFCTAVCPVGTVLGLCSKKGVLRINIKQDKCISCMKCKKICPTGCIDISLKNKAIDNERCILCMNCMSTCPVNAVKYSVCSTVSRKKAAKEETNLSRRNFLIGGAVTVAAIGAGSITQKAAKAYMKKNGSFIVPPGAGSPERFLAKCTACHLCVTNCRGNVLKPVSPKFKSIRLAFDKGFCEYNCNNCSKICPTGAIEKISLEQKRRWRIGLAKLNLGFCIPYAIGTPCAACSEQCPTGALQMVDGPKGITIPEFHEDICIGCGACENACPAKPARAIIIQPVPIQVLAEDPIDYFRKLKEEKGEGTINFSSDEWLI